MHHTGMLGTVGLLGLREAKAESYDTVKLQVLGLLSTAKMPQAFLITLLLATKPKSVLT